MANEVSNIKINIAVNLVGQPKLVALNANIMQLVNSFRSLSGVTKPTADNLNKIGGKVAVIGSDMKIAATGTEKYVKAAVGLSTVLGRMQVNSAKAANAIKNIGAAASPSARAIGSLTEKIRQIEKVMDPVFRAGFRMQMVGNDMKNLGRNIFNFLGSVMSAWGDFEFAANRAAGAMGLFTHATEPGQLGLTELYDTLINVSKEMQLFPAEEIARATYFWQSTTGTQVKTLSDLEATMSRLTPIIKAAALTETSLEASIKGVYSILKQYGLGLRDTEGVTEKLFLVTQQTAAEFPDLINSFKMVGPVAAANNVSFEDMVVLLGDLADAGIRGTMAGRGLRQMFIQTVRPSKLAAAAIEKLYTEFGKSNDEFAAEFRGKTARSITYVGGKFVGVAKHIENLAKALRNSSQADRNAFLARISTANELPILTALVVKQIDKLNDNTIAWKNNEVALEGASEVMDKAFNLLRTSWKGTWGAFQRGLEALRLAAGPALAASFGPMLEKLREIMTRIEQWIKLNPKLIAGLGKMAGYFAAFAMAGGSVMIFVGAMTALAASFAVALPIVGRAVAIVTGFGGAVIAIASAIISNWTEIEKALVRISGNIDTAFGSAGKAGSGLQNVMESLTAVTKPFFDFVVVGIVNLVASATDLIRTLNEFAPTSAIIQGLVKSLGFLIGLQILRKVLEFSKLAAAIKAIGVAVGLTSRMGPQLAFGDRIAHGASNATLAVRGLRGAIGGLLSSLGPLNLIIIGVIAAAAAFSTAYEGNDDFKGFVDSITNGFRDLDKEIAESSAEFGKFGQKMQEISLKASHSIESLAKHIQATEKDIANMTAAFDAGTLGTTGNPLANNAGQFATALKSLRDDKVRLKEAQVDILKDMHKFVDDMNLQFDTDIDYQGYAKIVTDIRRLGVEYEQSGPIAAAFFEAQRDGTDLTSEGIIRLFDLIKAQNPTLNFDNFLDVTDLREKFSVADAEIRQLMDRLNNTTPLRGADAGHINLLPTPEEILQDISRLNSIYADGSPAMRDAAKTLMAGYPEAVQRAGEEAAALAELGVGELANALFTSLDTQLGGQDFAKLTARLKGAFGDPLKILVDLTNSSISKNAKDLLNSDNHALVQAGEKLILDYSDSIRKQIGLMPADMSAAWGYAWRDIYAGMSETQKTAWADIDQQAEQVIKNAGMTKQEVSALYDTSGMKDGILIALKEAGDETKGGVATGIGAIVYDTKKSVLDALAGLFQPNDWKKAIQKSLKNQNSTSKGLIAKVKEYLDKTMTAGFKGTDTHARLEAQAWVEDLNGQMTTAMAALFQSGDVSPIQNLQKYLKGIFSEGIPPGLSKEQVAALQAIMTEIDTLLSQTTPGSHLTIEVPTLIGLDKLRTDLSSLRTLLGETKKGVYLGGVKGEFGGGGGKTTMPPIVLPAADTTATVQSLNTLKATTETTVATVNTTLMTADGTASGIQLIKTFSAGMVAATTWATGIAGGLVMTVIAKMASYSAYTGGYFVGVSFGQGLARSSWYIEYKARELVTAVAAIFGGSLPTEGPLTHPWTGSNSIARAWGDGFEDAIPYVQRKADRLASAASGRFNGFESSFGSMSLESSHKRAIDVNIKVTSPDGSVDRAKASDIEKGIIISGVIEEALHLGTVG